MTAAQLAFPKAQIKGCFVYLSQSLLRKIGNVGLKTGYNDQEKIPMTLKMKSLASVAFVLMEKVAPIYEDKQGAD